MAHSRLCSSSLLLAGAVCLVFFCAPAAAFGAGNIASIAKIEGTNWRHGDIEDTLLNILMSRAAGGKKFGKLDVKRVYFGNWLRDYSQAVDVGTVKYVSAEAIRIILWVLGFMSFGYGTKEFEVTADRLGCYRPEEHIDNPKDYADNIDARQYDRRLRGPVDERTELAVNPKTGLKNYIATENIGITSSAGLVRNLFGRSIQLGRQFARSGNKADLHEALRLLGTGCHCLEDYSAHSNYTELALLELGERGVFPHVGRRTAIRLPETGATVYPIITGTFGGVDFLHSVMGEFSDKATQSEISELQGTFEQSQSGANNTSLLQDLLSQVPSGLLGGGDQASKADELQANAQAAQMQQTHISPREPEAFTRELQEISKQIYPILEWHDELMQSITETIEKIPILPDLIEQLQDQLNIFVFSLLAPFVVPIINQVKTELNTGSSEIIQSSKEKQLIVFHDDYSSNPTHSMLSKDHFSNVLNEPAGKVASQVLKWVVPQLIACWDDERIDVNRTLTRVINGVFHHPNLRDFGDDGAVDGRRAMFMTVQQWWGSKDEQEKETLREQLSREGVEEGSNHKPGVYDNGHGCGKPLGMPTMKTAQSSGAIGGGATGGILGNISDAFAGKSQYDPGYTAGGGQLSGGGSSGGMGKAAAEVVGGGAIGGIVGGLVGGLGGDLLGGAFGGSESKKQTYQKQTYGEDGSYTQSVTETGRRPQYGDQQETYGQAQYSQTTYADGRQRQEFQRYEQGNPYGQSGYGEQVIRESRPTYGGGFEDSTETRFERPGGGWHSEVQNVRTDEQGGYQHESKRYSSGGYREGSDSDDSSKKRRHHKKHGSDSDSDDERRYQSQGGYGRQQQSYGEEPRYNEEPRYSEEHRYGEEPRYSESQRYGESRKEYGSGYADEGYGEFRNEEQRNEYGSGGYRGGSERFESGGLEYGRGVAGRYSEPSEEYGQREEPGGGGGYSESHEDEGGYGQGQAYQERRYGDDGYNEEY